MKLPRSLGMRPGACPRTWHCIILLAYLAAPGCNSKPEEPSVSLTEKDKHVIVLNCGTGHAAEVYLRERRDYYLKDAGKRLEEVAVLLHNATPGSDELAKAHVLLDFVLDELRLVNQIEELTPTTLLAR